MVKKILKDKNGVPVPFDHFFEFGIADRLMSHIVEAGEVLYTIRLCNMDEPRRRFLCIWIPI
jgi:hypothetical protein